MRVLVACCGAEVGCCCGSEAVEAPDWSVSLLGLSCLCLRVTLSKSDRLPLWPCLPSGDCCEVVSLDCALWKLGVGLVARCFRLSVELMAELGSGCAVVPRRIENDCSRLVDGRIG